MQARSMRAPKSLITKLHPACQMVEKSKEETSCLAESRFTVEDATVAGLPKRATLEPGINAHRELVSGRLSTLGYLPTSGLMCKIERRMLYTEVRNHSLLLSGDADRSCSMFGRDFVVGGEDAADGGDVVESAPSESC